MPTTDFASLAKSFGGTVAPAPAAPAAPGGKVDYSTLAKSFGGNVAGAPAAPSAPVTAPAAPAAAPDDRNIVQKAIGTFLDPIIETGVHTGEAVGDLAIQGVNKATGGALDKYTQSKFGQPLSARLQTAEDTPVKAPVFGTAITPAKDITPETTAGDALGTVALALPTAPLAGAAFGAANALKQKENTAGVAINTVAGAIGGKILEYGFNAVSPYIEKAAAKYGAPLIDKLAAYIPDSAQGFMSDLSSKLTTPVADTVADVAEKPGVFGNAINKTTDTAAKIVNAPFDAAESAVGKIKSFIAPDAEDIAAKRLSALQDIESKNSVVRRAFAQADAKGINSKEILSSKDILNGAVDSDGTIKTSGEGGPLEKFNSYIEPKEAVVTKLVAKEGNTLPLDDVEAKLKGAVNSSGITGEAKLAALNKVDREVSGLALDADKDGNIPLSKIQEAKVYKYAHINYTDPDAQATDKTIARVYKTLVEQNTKSADVKALNDELSKDYAIQGVLEKLDGKKVAGGRAGKYTAKLFGAVAGSHFGPLGSVAGAEIASRVEGARMAGAFGGDLTKSFENSPGMDAAIKEANTPAVEKPQLALPAPADSTVRSTVESGPTITLPKNLEAYQLGTDESVPFQSKNAGPLQSTQPTAKISPSIANIPKILPQAVDKSIVPKIIGEHISSANQILENTSAEDMAKLGGMSELISRTKTNIVDGLNGEGLTDAANKIKNIDITGIKTIPEFESAIKNFLSKTILPSASKGSATVGAVLGGAALGGGLAAGRIPSTTTYTAPVKPEAKLPSSTKPLINVAKVRAAIASNETASVKKPYQFTQPSGVKAYGKALGKYQITEAELKAYSPKFLGATTTPKQFLASPSLQDQYITNKIKYLQGKGLTLPQILASHRGGFSDLSKISDKLKKYKDYVTKGLIVYNSK